MYTRRAPSEFQLQLFFARAASRSPHWSCSQGQPLERPCRGVSEEAVMMVCASARLAAGEAALYAISVAQSVFEAELPGACKPVRAVTGRSDAVAWPTLCQLLRAGPV